MKTNQFYALKRKKKQTNMMVDEQASKVYNLQCNNNECTCKVKVIQLNTIFYIWINDFQQETDFIASRDD